MGAFDDLIPSTEAARGAFDDLIPSPDSARGAFDDLIPEGSDPYLARARRDFPELPVREQKRMALSNEMAGLRTVPQAGVFQGFQAEFPERAGEWIKGAAQQGTSFLKATGALLNRGLADSTEGDSGALIEPVTPETPEQNPLYRLGAGIESGMDTALPPPDSRDTMHDIARGAGQMEAMVGLGGISKALGATERGAALVATLGGGVQEFDDAFIRARQQGDDPDTAFSKALGYSTVAGLIENRLGAGRIVRKFFPEPTEAVKRMTGLGLSKELIKNIIAGGLEETSQAAAQDLIVAGQRPTLESTMQNFQREGIPGAVIEGVFGAPGSVIAHQEHNAQADMERSINEALQRSGQQIALEHARPMRGTGESLVANRPADESFVKGAFDDLIPSVPQAPDAPQPSPRVAPAGTPAAPVTAGTSPRADAMSELTGVQNEAAQQAESAKPNLVVQQVSDIKAMLANLEATLKANQGAALLQPTAPTPSGTTDVEAETQKSIKRAETPVQPEAGAATLGGQNVSNSVVGNDDNRVGYHRGSDAPLNADDARHVTRLLDQAKITEAANPNNPAEVIQEATLDVQQGNRRIRDFRGKHDGWNIIIETPALPGGGAKTALRAWRYKPHEAQLPISRIEQPAGLVESQGSPSGTPTAAVQPESASPITTAQPVAQPQGRDVQPVGDNLPEPVHKASSNFDKLVRDYGPQAGWSTGDEAIYNSQLTAGSNLSHGIKAKVEAGKQMQAMRRAALSYAVPAAERNNYDLTTPQGRAAALPRLEAWIKQKFPGDNSIDQRRALEQFARNETPTPTTAEQRARTKQDEQALRRVIAQNAGLSELQGLVVHKPTRGASGQAGGVGADQRGARYISAAETQALRELDRQQGTHTILVDSPGDEIPFNGFKDPRSNVILIHARTELPLIKVAGHEVWHHIRMVHQVLYADTFDALFKLIPPEQKEKFKKRLAQRGQPTDDRTAYDELMGDYFGDNMGDPNFWQRLAKEAPELFKRLARIVKAWLDKLIAKLKGKKVEGYESEQHFSDLTKARDVVANALVQAAKETQYRKAGLPASDGGLNDVGDLETFSKPPGEDFFGAPESVEEQRQRIKNEELKIKNAKAKAAMQERAAENKPRTNNKPLTLFHGTKADYSDSDIATGKRMFGIHLSTSEDAAKKYGNVKRFELSPDAKILDLASEGSDDLWQFMLKHDILDAEDAENVDLQNYINGGRLFQYDLSSKTHYADSVAIVAQGLGYDLVKMPDDLGGHGGNVAFVVVNAQVLTLPKPKETQEMFGSEVRRDKSGQGSLFSKPERDAGPIWRSNIQDTLESWQNKGTPEQLRAHLAKTKGAMDEAEWIGLDEWLATTGNSVTKQEVQEFVKANTVDVKEVEKGTPQPRLTDAQRKRWEQLRDIGRANRTVAEDDEFNALRPGLLQEKEEGTKFSNYQLPGGENYRELLLTLPLDERARYSVKQAEGRYRIWDDSKGEFYRNIEGKISGYLNEATANHAVALLNKGAINGGRPAFHSGHFDEPNILAHVRFNERTDADGKRVLFLEEVQSDWHQKGRKEGYAGLTEAEQAELKRLFSEFDAGKIGLDSPEYDRLNELKHKKLALGGIVPNAPFKATWPMLAMKRMVRYAAENGFDRIAWTTGEQQAERYDLSKHVREIRLTKSGIGGPMELVAVTHDGTPGITKMVHENQIADYIGKEAAEKLQNQEWSQDQQLRTKYGLQGNQSIKVLKGLDLKVGGEGMKGFYDKMLPVEVNKFVKKWGGRVGQVELLQGEYDDSGTATAPLVHSLDITPSMRDAAMQGMPMFSKPFQDDATKRSIRTMISGQPVPKQFRDIQTKHLGVQKYFEENLNLVIIATRKRLLQEFKKPADRQAAMERVGDYWLGKIPLSAVGGPVLQHAAQEFRDAIDALSLTAVNNGIVPDGQVKTWIGSTGEWLKRTYLAFDPDSDWNYDTLASRRKREPEIDRIWTDAEKYLRKQNPKATDGEIEAQMRRLIDRREVESALGGGRSERSAGYSVDTGSLIMRQDIPPELLEWMGQIKDPFTRAKQSSKWLSQFLARNLMQRELAKVGLEAGWFSETEDGRNHVQLFPNVTRLVPVIDPVTGLPVKTPSGNVEAEYRKQINRRVEPLHGLYTSPEMEAALSQFDGMLNTGIAASSRLNNLAPQVLLKGVGLWKMGKVALNPISYVVNSFGALTMRLMAGAVNPLHVVNAMQAIASRHAVVDRTSTLRMQRARSAYLLAVKQGVTGKGILMREVDASFGREAAPEAGKRAVAALADLVNRRGNKGARRRLGKALMDMLKVPGEIGIRFADDVARVSALMAELELSKKANPTFTEQKHADWAAERTENIYQTYERLPVVIRDASNIGVLSPFISFTAELFRNAGWIAYYGANGIASDNPHLRRDGAQKLAGLSAMIALPIVLAAMARSNADDDDEKAKRKVAALQRWFVPPWDRGEDVIIKSFSKDRIEYIPMGYLFPSSQLTRIPTEIAKIPNSENPELAINQMVDGMVSDWFSSGPFGTAIEAVSNTRAGGRKVTKAEGMRGWQQRAEYAWKNFRPGVVQIADEFWMAQTGEKGFAGREYTTEEIGWKLAGFRQRTINPRQAIPYIVDDFSRRWRDASSEGNKQPVKTPGNQAEIDEAKQYAVDKQAQLKREYKQFVKDAELIGFSEIEIYNIAKEREMYIPKKLKE